jgi:hypothetical protein
MCNGAQSEAAFRFRGFIALVTYVVGGWLASPAIGSTGLSQVSGIAVRGDKLLLVGDRTVGQIIEVALPGEIDGAEVRVQNPMAEFFSSPMALDLEGVDTFRGEQWVVLSERGRGVATSEGSYFEYPVQLGEFGGVGLEGLSVSDANYFVALWEGGFPDHNKLPGGIAIDRATALLPIACFHSLPSDTTDIACDGALVPLTVPEVPEVGQAFRAPDVVWGRNDTILVLLSSTDVEHKRFTHKWLQRFDRRGKPVDAPINLCDDSILPSRMHSLNFEGMDWLEFEDRLVLVDDAHQDFTVAAISVSPWPVSDPAARCNDGGHDD